MIDIKNEKEIAFMKKGGHMLAEALFGTLKQIKPGVSEREVDAFADRLIKEQGGEPGFKRVSGWHHATCISTNDVVVHGIPSDYLLKEGDVIGVDCGVFFGGLHTDMSETVRIVKGEPRVYPGSKDFSGDAIDSFLNTGKRALLEAIKVAKAGNRVGHISKTIQDIVEKEAGYGVTRSLIGHGVGKELHEDPEIPGYLHGKLERTPLLREGMTIAIEVIYSMGSREVMLDHDGWTIRSEDGSMSGVFERSVLITKDDPVILTQ
jgi:methionyl aminopeptidase